MNMECIMSTAVLFVTSENPAWDIFGNQLPHQINPSIMAFQPISYDQRYTIYTFKEIKVESTVKQLSDLLFLIGEYIIL